MAPAGARNLAWRPLERSSATTAAALAPTRPIVTQVLIAVNVAVYVVGLGFRGADSLGRRGGLVGSGTFDGITATGRHMLRDLPHAGSPDWGAADGSIRDETHWRIGAPLARLRDDELVNGAATLALSWPRS